MTIAIKQVRSVSHLIGPAGRRATFVDLGGDRVRYTLYGGTGRKQQELIREQARDRWAWLVKIGYRKWEDAR